jgi:hypothetical protein
MVRGRQFPAEGIEMPSSVALAITGAILGQGGSWAAFAITYSLSYAAVSAVTSMALSAALSWSPPGITAKPRQGAAG